MTKQLFILLAVSGLLSVNVIAQDSNQKHGNYGKRRTTKGSNYKEVIVDTVISSPYGTTRFYSYSFSAEGSDNDINLGPVLFDMWSLSPSALRELEQNQDHILRQVGEDASNLQQWMEQQVVARNERIKQYLRQQKEALFIDIMDLTPEEAKRFWPLYNEYSEKKEKISSKRQAINNTLRRANIYNTESKEAEALSKEYVDLLTQETSLQQEYHRRFKTVLSPVKVLMIYKAEDEFKLMMLRQREQGFDF